MQELTEEAGGLYNRGALRSWCWIHRGYTTGFVAEGILLHSQNPPSQRSQIPRRPSGLGDLIADCRHEDDACLAFKLAAREPERRNLAFSGHKFFLQIRFFKSRRSAAVLDKSD